MLRKQEQIRHRLVKEQIVCDVWIDHFMCAMGTRRRETHSRMGQVGKDSRRTLEPKSDGQVEVLKQRIRAKCSRQREWHVPRNESMPNLGNCK